MKVLIVTNADGSFDSVHGPFDNEDEALRYSYIHESRIPFPECLRVRYHIVPVTAPYGMRPTHSVKVEA